MSPGHGGVWKRTDVTPTKAGSFWTCTVGQAKAHSDSVFVGAPETSTVGEG